MKKIILFLVTVFVLSSMSLDGETYTLKKGETLYRVSRRFDVPVDILQQFNKIKDPSQLREGTEIEIPTLHTVAKGETLYSIARRYGVALDRLIETNRISDSRRLRVGHSLFIPDGGKSASIVSSEDPEDKADASSTGTDAQKTVQSFQDQLWPHPGKRVHLTGKMSGMVIQGNEGDKVVSVSTGRVVWVGPYRGFSRVVLIESAGRYIYVYAGNEATLVDVGDRVAAGEEIGILGRNAHLGVPQLYFLVYQNGSPVDPAEAPRG
jgi:murein DD-endopeptidase MepM/ murein hydrolase activator NlpD